MIKNKIMNYKRIAFSLIKIIVLIIIVGLKKLTKNRLKSSIQNFKQQLNKGQKSESLLKGRAFSIKSGWTIKEKLKLINLSFNHFVAKLEKFLY